MKRSASLLGLNVGDYFKLCNWQLLPPPSNNLPKPIKITPPPRPTVLSVLSVKDFFASCNWQLLTQIALEDNDSTSPLLPPPVASDPSPPIVLPCLTVAEFFSLCNWQSLPLEATIPQPLAVEPELPKVFIPESPLTIQVQTFLRTIPWEGNPEIGRLPQASSLPSIPPAEDEMNLNDLSNLF